MIGAALFGIGWGMSGICPGPAIALIGFLPNNLWIYLLGIAAGSYLGKLLPEGSRSPVVAAAE